MTLNIYDGLHKQISDNQKVFNEIYDRIHRIFELFRFEWWFEGVPTKHQIEQTVIQLLMDVFNDIRQDDSTHKEKEFIRTSDCSTGRIHINGIRYQNSDEYDHDHFNIEITVDIEE